jgi:uncharacterized protein YbcC (UPF0753/DUF2309 family)
MSFREDSAVEPGEGSRGGTRESGLGEADFAELRHEIEHAAHLLPSQGPITVFVHHNTLHAFEGRGFEAGVRAGAETYGCEPYLAEGAYRAELARGRIRAEDLSEVVLEDLGEDADFLIGFMGTRYHLRMAMLEHPLRMGPDSELRWLIAETDALERFREEASSEVRRRLVESTKRWVLEDGMPARSDRVGAHDREVIDALLREYGRGGLERWDERRWESFTLHLLWRVCHAGVHGVKRHGEPAHAALIRHRDLLMQATGRDTDLLVHDFIIRYCGAFLDQGFATWTLPGRERGFLRAFEGLYADARLVEPWLERLPQELARWRKEDRCALGLIDESLRVLGVGEGERGAYLSRTLLALRGWAGMLWQMETNAEWAAHPAPRGTLEEYLAVRLLLERLALEWTAREALGERVELRVLRAKLRHLIPHAQRVSVDQRAYLVFQLAQMRGWSPAELHRQTKADWTRLVWEIESFGEWERRRIYHLAYERRYRIRTLDAIAAHDLWLRRRGAERKKADFQVIFCIDEREESMRRHLEELDPGCETYGVAGFFGAAMYYRGVDEAHYRPLCPVNIKPRHYVVEEPSYSFEEAHRLQMKARRGLGKLSHRLHIGTRTFLGGLLTGLVGSAASIPLLMRVLLPRRTAQIRGLFGRMVVPPVTQLRLEREEAEPGPEEGHWGFTVGEMAGIVEGVLRAIGLTREYSDLVIVMGHGSASLNNPQEAAHDCGACGGARGGPNARAFAQMANDYRVRRELAVRGLAIPERVHFVGAYHNTCDDNITYYDLDRLPAGRRRLFERAEDALGQARRWNAHERCRRFESAETGIDAWEALRHVEARAEDLSQTRPEYGHATNAVCIVGRRERTRGLFLDRRSFLTSYDPAEDDAAGTTLGNLLRAVVPVCAGISLEYYFSRVDSTGYGCGTKLPHNITSLLGVMDGAASDLRTGLPWQMVEIHEPMRILFVIETRPEVVEQVLARERGVEQLVSGGWVQVAVLDPEGPGLHVLRSGGFERYEPEDLSLPEVARSPEWYGGKRDHLGYATVTAGISGGRSWARDER